MIIDKEIITIGYQGDIGSNSEEAAHLFARNRLLSTDIDSERIKYLPLISSANVLKALSEGCIDFGVCAVRNNIGGTVRETEDALLALAMKKQAVSVCDRESLHIHHCVFVNKEPDPRKSFSIQRLISHKQVFAQCRNYIKNNFPEAKLLETDDQAKAAHTLAIGEYPEGTAVICRKNAGTMNGLHLTAENIEDSPQNITDFEVFIVREQFGLI